MDQMELFNANKNLAYWVANKRLLSSDFKDRWNRIGYDEEDAYQFALMGLWRASRGFDETAGYQFTTYATRCIWHSITTAARKADSPTHISDERLDSTIVNMPDLSLDDEDELDFLRAELESMLPAIGTASAKALRMAMAGIPTKKIAEIEGLQLRTAAERIQQAKRSLRELIEFKKARAKAS
jgi:RNA polymerase sigma factor (sigma-70 family)